MFAAHEAAHLVAHISTTATWLLQETTAQPQWDLISLWKQMAWVARIVVFILFIMSGWSFGVMIDRYMAFNAESHRPTPNAVSSARSKKAGNHMIFRVGSIL